MENPFDRYARYENLKVDLKKDGPRTKKVLKIIFSKFGDSKNKGVEGVIKTLVHALAEEELSKKDKHFFQALLYSKPELTNPHLIAGLRVSHKTLAGGIQRVNAITQLLERRQFGRNQRTSNNLIDALVNPHISERVERILTSKYHANQQTSNNLIVALKDRLVADRIEKILASKYHATQQTSNNLIAALVNPQLSDSAQRILASKYHATQQTSNNLIAALKDRKVGDKVERILSSEHYATQQTSNNLIAALKENQKAERIERILLSEHYVTQQNSINLISALKDQQVNEIIERILLSPQYQIRPVLDSLVDKLGSKDETFRNESLRILSRISRTTEGSNVLKEILRDGQISVLIGGNKRDYLLKPERRQAIEAILNENCKQINSKKT